MYMKLMNCYPLYSDSKVKQLEKVTQLTEKEQGKVILPVTVSAVCPQHTHTGTIDALSTQCTCTKVDTT